MKTVSFFPPLFALVFGFFLFRETQMSGPAEADGPVFGLVENDTVYQKTGAVDTTGVRGSGWKPSPEKYNYRDSVNIAVADQKQVPRCVGHTIASAVALKFNLFCRPKCACREKLPPFSAAYLYNQVSQGRLVGISLGETLDLLQKQGICPEKIFPNDPDKATPMPPPAARNTARKFCCWKPERIFLLPKEYPNDRARHELALDLLRKHLSNDLPVMVGLRCPDNFRGFKANQPVYRPGDELPENANHAALVVGYDNETSTVEILNSFGTDWGDGGFCRIGYADFCRMARYGYVARFSGEIGEACKRR